MRVFTRPMAGASQGTGVNCAVTWADSRKSPAAYGMADRTDMGDQERETTSMMTGFKYGLHRMAVMAKGTRDHMYLSSLPQFKSLLVHGPYLPVAPIHLALSVPPPNTTLLFSPSRNALLHALQSHNDRWLTTRSGTGTVAGMSSRVTILFAAWSRRYAPSI